MQFIETLRRNDPAETSISIILRYQNSDADLAQALEQNQFVQQIELDLTNVQTANWGALLRVIATREKLVSVTVRDAYSEEARNAPAALVSAILQAIQQNTSLRTVCLRYLHLPVGISTFLDTTSSITAFVLLKCDMEPVQQEQGARDLALALQRNTNIQTLELGLLEEVCMLSILQGLQSNHSLKNLVISSMRHLWVTRRSFSDGTNRAIQQLLESTTSIEHFEVRERHFSRDEFHPVSQGIVNSRSVSKLTFKSCDFSDIQSTALFRSILQNKRNLTSLCLNDCNFSGAGVPETVISTLSQPDSLLRVFELQQPRFNRTLSNVQFRNLLRAVEKSKLNHFGIGHIQYVQELRVLADSIPLMRIKELQVVISSGYYNNSANAKQALIMAVKNNFSLRSVEARLHGNDLFDNDTDKKTLAFCADRNERLDQWVDNPDKVDDRKVWPEALKLAEKAGPDSLFRGLRSVLESDHIMSSRSGRRKRKRPQFYVPS